MIANIVPYVRNIHVNALCASFSFEHDVDPTFPSKCHLHITPKTHNNTGIDVATFTSDT